MKNWGGVEKLNQELNGYLPLNGGTLTGDLNLNTNSLYLDTDGYQINSFSGRLQIKQATDLTPNSVAITEYNNNENKQLHFVVNDSSDGSHNTQVVLKKNVLQLYNNTISNGSTTTGYVNIKGVADAIGTHDAVNLGQLNSKSTQIFDGVCIGFNGNKCNMVFNEENHNILYYGVPPEINNNYAVYIPNNDISRAFIITTTTDIASYYKKMAIDYGGISCVTATQSRGDNTLDLYITTPDGLPSDDLITNLTSYLNSETIKKRMAIAIDIQVMAPTANTLTSYIQLKQETGYTFASTADAVKENLANFFSVNRLGLVNIREQMLNIINTTPHVLSSYTKLIAPKKNTANSENLMIVLGCVTTQAKT